MSQQPLRVAVITLSMRVAQGQREDLGGDAVASRMQQAGMQIAERHVIADDRDALQARLQALCDEHRVDVIVTTGGTGVTEFDVTPEATQAVIEKRLPGMEWAMMQAGLQKTPHAMLSRAVAGTRGKTLIINLPGNPKGAVENLEAILPAIPHAVQLLSEKQVSDRDHQPRS
ncbi:MAG: MogA/MoaB family molybdenum cofactor biosynthesis protein [candidate division KSB1 bacterium]|nr:MogA/MoaB family molybdenum cofactor biosynthesis protein [candidate division KSB1 bacterium]MDQ7064148.1 MogA/MoaB family molybdenum cofactor biosynthesis protein [candidate division KSB1 bacterium]